MRFSLLFFIFHNARQTLSLKFGNASSDLLIVQKLTKLPLSKALPISPKLLYATNMFLFIDFYENNWIKQYRPGEKQRTMIIPIEKDIYGSF